MNRVRTMVSKTTVLSAVGVVVAMAFASTSLGQQSTPEVLAKWVSFKPALPHAVAAQPCGKSRSKRLGRASIKVGQPYVLSKYDMGAKIGWMGELFWDPNRAVAKRTFKIYDLAEMDSAQWEVLREEFAGSPASVAFVSPSVDGYVATPVKWNTALAKAFTDAYGVAEKVNDEEKWIVKAMAGEILGKGNMGEDPLVPGLNPMYLPSIDPISQLRLTMGAVVDYDCGHIKAVERLVPTVDVFLGISDTPNDFTVPPVGEVITASGYWGQPLGTVMPSWPSKDD